MLFMEAAAALRTTLPAPYFTLGQEPRILWNKIIVHIDIILLHNSIPIIIEHGEAEE